MFLGENPPLPPELIQELRQANRESRARLFIQAYHQWIPAELQIEIPYPRSFLDWSGEM